VIKTASGERDAWSGFCGFVESIYGMQAADRGFSDVMTMTFPTAKAFETQRDESATALGDLIDRVKATGRLRHDFVHQDVPLILMANSGVVNATRGHEPEAWRRLAGYLMQSFALNSPPPLPDPPARRAMFKALMRFPQKNPRTHS
jgi:hypothetical protein